MKAGEEDPLTDFIMADIIDQNPNLTQESLDRTKAAVDSIIHSRMTVPEASRSLSGICECARALDKLQTILHVSDNPIPFNPHMPEGLTLQNRKKTHPWSAYEDQRLVAGIHRYGLDDWTQVSAFVGNGRTRAQCSQRWFRGLDPSISKTRWTTEQDDRLLTLVVQFGDKSWTSLAKNVADRCDVQCRYRYLQLQKEPDFNERMERARARVAEGHGIPLVEVKDTGKKPRAKNTKKNTPTPVPPQQGMVPVGFQVAYPQPGMVMHPMMMNGQMMMMQPPFAQPVMPMPIQMQYPGVPMGFVRQMPQPGPSPERQRRPSRKKVQPEPPKKEEEREVEPEPPIVVPPGQQQQMYTAPAQSTFMISSQNSFMLSGQNSFSGWDKFNPFDDAKQGGALFDWNNGISPQVSGTVLQSGFRM